MFRETETTVRILDREREINNIGIYLQNIRISKKPKRKVHVSKTPVTRGSSAYRHKAGIP